MRARLVFVLCGLLTSVAGATGGSFSGGENGVACFSSSAVAAKALDAEGRILPTFKKKILKLYAAEYWEGAAPENPCRLGVTFVEPVGLKLKMPAAQRSVDQLIEDALASKYFEKNRHLFLELVHRTRTEVAPFTRWNPRRQLDPVNDNAVSVDSRSCRPAQPNTTSQCRIVQIARWDRGVDDQYTVTFDQDLYHHPSFDNVNRALVRMHETLYIIAGKLGHHRAELVRAFVRFIFQGTDFGNFRDPDRELAGAMVRNGLAFYPGLLAARPDAQLTPRMRAYVAFLETMTRWATEHGGLTIGAVATNETLALRFLADVEGSGVLTDEMAFLWEAGRQGEYFDRLLDGSQIEVDGKAVSAMTEACFGPSLAYHGTFSLVLVKILEGHWALPADRIEELRRLSKRPMRISERLDTCEIIRETLPQDELSGKYYAMCRLRERANRYCVQSGFEWRARR